MVTRLGSFEFFPEPSRIIVKATKLLGSSALIGEEKDAYYPIGAKAREISLEGWLIDEKKRGIGLQRTLEEQLNSLRDLVKKGDLVSFYSDLTGALIVAITDIDFRHIKGILDRRYTIKLLEYKE